MDFATRSTSSGTSGTATVNSTQNQRDIQAIQLCELAFQCEHEGNFVEAYHGHSQAVAALDSLIHDARFLDRERKRVATKQLKFHQARLEVIRPLKDGVSSSSFVLLPSIWSARQEFRDKRRGSHGQALTSISFVCRASRWMAKCLDFLLMIRNVG